MPGDHEIKSSKDSPNWCPTKYLVDGAWAENINAIQQENDQNDVDMARFREFSRFLMNELSDPLTAISSYTEMCRDMLAETKLHDKVVQESLKVGSRSFEELLELIAFNSGRLRDLLTSFKKPLNEIGGSWDVVHVDELIFAALANLATDLDDNGVTVEIQRRPPRAPILADPIQLGRLLSAVLTNSVQNVTRVESGGKPRRLTISFKKETDATGGGNGIEVRFVDSGPDYPDNITRPFFDYETNEVRLEMAAWRTIMEQQGGTLDIEHTSSGETGLRLRFPICKVAPAKLAELQGRSIGKMHQPQDFRKISM